MLALRDSRSCESTQRSEVKGQRSRSSGWGRRRYPEDFVQRQLAQLRAHGGLGQLRDGVLRVLHAVTRLEGKSGSEEAGSASVQVLLLVLNRP